MFVIVVPYFDNFQDYLQRFIGTYASFSYNKKVFFFVFVCLRTSIYRNNPYEMPQNRLYGRLEEPSLLIASIVLLDIGVTISSCCRVVLGMC